MALFLTSCDTKGVFDEYTKVEEGQWDFQAPVVFEVTIEETGIPYHVFTNFRHTNDYPYSNLWITLSRKGPSGEELAQRFELTFAQQDGKWLGSGLGSSITQEKRILSDLTFPEAGTYTFTLRHDMRLKQVPAINYVGLRLEKAK